MKKLLACAGLAAATLLPATPAAAFDGLPAGTRSCGPMQYGFIVWVVNPKTGEPKDLVTYCQPIGPPPNAPSPTT